jgi:hypothetical protein
MNCAASASLPASIPANECSRACRRANQFAFQEIVPIEAAAGRKKSPARKNSFHELFQSCAKTKAAKLNFLLAIFRNS